MSYYPKEKPSKSRKSIRIEFSDLPASVRWAVIAFYIAAFINLFNLIVILIKLLVFWAGKL